MLLSKKYFPTPNFNYASEGKAVEEQVLYR